MPRAKGWEPRALPPVITAVIPDAQCWEKDVEDGRLKIIRSKEAGWHLSISFKEAPGRERRYPSWDEIHEARYGFLPDAAHIAMHLPSKEDYVNFHDTTFHLWELPQ